MEEEKVRLQHYVPRVYLKNFSISDMGEYYIWTLNKKTEKTFNSNIKNVAVKEEFYNKVSEEQDIERLLRNIETKVDNVIQKLIKIKDVNNLDGKEKDILAEFIAYQMIRTKETREEIKEIPKQILEKYRNELHPKLKEQIIDSMKEESLREMHKQIIKTAEEFKEKIKNLKWITLINKIKLPFWTSDNPVAEYNSENLFPYGNLGLECFGFEIHFPISSEVSLKLCDNRKFSKLPSKEIIRDYRRIIYERDLQVKSSNQFVFSNNNNFDFAKVMLKENPSLKEGSKNFITH